MRFNELAIALSLLSVALAAEECTLGRLFVSDSDSPTVLAIDLDTGSVASKSGSGFSANPAIYANSDASHVFLNHRSETGIVRIMHAGVSLESHGEHLHIDLKDPEELSLKVEGDMPTHVTSTKGETTIFFDGRRDSSSSVLSFQDTADKLQGSSLARTFEYGPMDPQHGNAGPMGNNVYFVSQPNPEYKTGLTDSSLSTGFHIIDKDSNLLYDANNASDPDRSCPLYHGHSNYGEYHVFGCRDGILVIRYIAATNAVSSRLMRYHDSGRRTGRFFSHEEQPVIVAQHSAPIALIRWKAGPDNYQPSRDVLEFEDTASPCGAAFEKVDGDVLLVLLTNGTLMSYDVSSRWTYIHSLPVVPAFSCGGGNAYPRLIAGYNRAFLSIPEDRIVQEIEVWPTRLELGRKFDVSAIRPGGGAVAGLSSQAAKIGACGTSASLYSDSKSGASETMALQRFKLYGIALLAGLVALGTYAP
eukprot:1591851-Rhodomonas_salina.3